MLAADVRVVEERERTACCDARHQSSGSCSAQAACGDRNGGVVRRSSNHADARPRRAAAHATHSFRHRFRGQAYLCAHVSSRQYPASQSVDILQPRQLRTGLELLGLVTDNCQFVIPLPRATLPPSAGRDARSRAPWRRCRRGRTRAPGASRRRAASTPSVPGREPCDLPSSLTSAWISLSAFQRAARSLRIR